MPIDNPSPLRLGGLRVVLGKGGGNEGGDDAATAFTSVRQGVAHEVNAGVVEKVGMA